MKKLLQFKKIIILVLLAGISSVGMAQVLYEGFAYPTPDYIGGNGAAGTFSNNWTTHSVTTGQTTTINLQDGSLTYTGLVTSTGNKVDFFSNANATSRDINRGFVSTATTLYYSALVSITDNSQITVTGDYFMHFGATAGTAVTSFGGRLGAKSVNTGTNFRFVIQNTSTGTPTFTDNGADLNYGTTYLVVVKYDRTAVPTVATMWVNPVSLGATEPAGSVSNNSGTGSFAAFNSICLRENGTSPKAFVDEIRVGETWADVTPAASIPTTADLFFSEYIEGSSNNKAVEIFNGTGADVDLSAYTVKASNNGAGWGFVASTPPAADTRYSLPLSGTLANGDVFVIYNSTAALPAIITQGDLGLAYNSTVDGAIGSNVPAFNGDDALGLFKADVLIDVIGTPDTDPGSGWDVAGVAVATSDHTMVRKATVTAGNTDWAVAAGTNADDSEWIIYPKDDTDYIGSHTFGDPGDVTAPTSTATPTNADIDVAINTSIVLTFDEAIRNIDNSEITDANVASLLTLKETDASGVDVPFTATINVDKKVITATPTTDLKNGQVYYAAIAPVEDAADNATTMSSMTFTTISATASTISDVAITETSPYFAGDVIKITWVSSNVTDVKIEAWIPSENAWQELFASTPSDGSEIFTIPADAQYSADYKLRVTDIADALVTAESSTFTIIALANDLITLRSLPVNSMVKYTGIATVTFTRTSRNQKYIQDATAAVLIDDPTTAPGFISGTYAIGDGITNIVGKIALYNDLIEFVPTVPTGETATGTAIVPEVRTLTSLTSADQSKLVKIVDFAFLTPTQYDIDGKFVSSKNYDIDGSDNTIMAYRTAFFEADYIGGMVPVGPISAVVLVGQYKTQMQITARSWSDMTVPTVAGFDADKTFALTGESVSFMDMSSNHPTSWEWTFEGGTPATSTEQNPVVTYSAKGSYAVTLKATNAAGGNNTVTKTDFIGVGVLGFSTLQSVVSVYPNPSNGKMFITNPSKETQVISVFNAFGKQVNNSVSSKDVISFDISGQAKGIYLIRITNKTTKAVQLRKIVLD